VRSSPSRQARWVVRDREILEAALRLFAENGYHGTSVDDIARAANTSKGGVYFHFPSKGDLFLALLDYAARQLLARVEAAVRDVEDPTLKLERGLEVFVRTVASHRPLARLFLVEGFGAGPAFQAKLREIHDLFIGLIKDQLEAAVSQGRIQPVDTELISIIWFGALYQLLLRWLSAGQPTSLEESYRQLVSILAKTIGLGPGLPDQEPD